ncbi:hypothetical protein AC629_42590, partial [Bradyrhizobium sp. NAS80.1]|uniref:hypothetical protein n=1 Tax=Bradyrhizobium sp. NAS80.1 TaxID=1680159 RepID=UPI0009606738
EGPMINNKPMFAPEIAERLGITKERFYLNRQKYHMIDKMPRPMNSTGRPAYDRASMEAWFSRHHPLRQQRPANDITAPLQPHNDEEWRDFLHKHYAQPAE